MTEKIILYVALFLIYFNIGGLATTNILRLTRGNKNSILNPKCFCDSCGADIPPLLQLPVISFLICRGRCKSCGTRIPVFPLMLELAVMVGMFTISVLFRLSAIGVLLSYAYYETVRIITVTVLKKRETDFIKSYAVSVISMTPFLLLTLFVSLIYSTI